MVFLTRPITRPSLTANPVLTLLEKAPDWMFPWPRPSTSATISPSFIPAMSPSRVPSPGWITVLRRPGEGGERNPEPRKKPPRMPEPVGSALARAAALRS